jgi:hypothetical protein
MAIAFVGLILLVVPRAPGANIWPVGGDLRIHVQPATTPPAPPATTCAEIVQHSEETGLLDFGLYLTVWPYSYALGIETLELRLDWPSNWVLVGGWVPHEGTADDFMEWYGGLECTLNWQECATWEWGLGVLDLLRLQFQVTGPGTIRVVSEVPDIELCEPWEVWITDVHAFPASAGDLCGFVQETCPPSNHCTPEANASQLLLQAPQGQQLHEQLTFTLHQPGMPRCIASCQATETWIAVDGVVEASMDPARDQTYRVDLDVDTTALAPGTYRAWVQVDSGGCRACTEVVLEVLTATGVPPGDDGVSWGQIKRLY